MSQKITVALLYGGKSQEHEISLISAASVFNALDRDQYTVIPIGMDKNGCFFQNEDQPLRSLHLDVLPVKSEQARALPAILENGRFAVDADVVFPVVHGNLYEDGCLQGLLKLADKAFVGCDVLSSAIGMDKDIQRRLASLLNIRTAGYLSVSKYVSPEKRAAFAQHAVKSLGLPLFVKPCSSGSSVGIHKVHHLEELLSAIEDAGRYDETILVEEFIQGREIEVAVLEQRAHLTGPRVSLPGEIRTHHADGFYSYAAKYLETESLELFAPAVLNPQLTEQIQTMAVELFTALKCQGMARVDFFVNDANGAIYFSEVNTIPGFTSVSMYPKLWSVSGLPYSQLLDELIALAIEHHHNQQQLVKSYT